ncbi:hypothetical protein Apar_0200 [Lancefieldella parvula DSM 20469]|uniref:Type I restriction modification DNA specificity domain-containing protein n=1 Tax=Lancefieldella parvula (strain ATCC 33793 / DSM 20469 / CCUG 32760 / JCM 10300 / KCTC 3663 / VPI 0546 / 1246) TaxID=521095 RepID=C8W945_LANP1|nr:restriction endonuclease subunit S [Lancefieldella parvula]ACV50633.1 hypothetical protein Apar_0200 [Lancefieldella parvula DSM 20469]
MPAAYQHLGALCSVKTGAPVSRAKRQTKGVPFHATQVLVPKAIENGRVINQELVEAKVSAVKEDLLTHCGDVILKTSTPYDCAYIDCAHEGLLVTSFGLIIRPLPDADIDMRYLAAFLTLPQTRQLLQSESKGVTLQLLKKKDILDIPVLTPSKSVQQLLAELFENTQKRKELYRLAEAKSDQLLFSTFDQIAMH